MSKTISVSIPEGSGDALAAAADFFTQLATIAYGVADEQAAEGSRPSLMVIDEPADEVPTLPVPDVPLVAEAPIPPVAEAPILPVGSINPPGAFTPDTPTTLIELDSAGYPWDEQIHGETKKKTKKDGVWKLKRNVDKKLVDLVQDEAASQGYGPASIDTTPVPETPLAPSSPPAPPPVPPAPAALLTPDQRMTGAAKGITYQEYIDKNWTEPQLIDAGFMLPVGEAPTLAPEAMDFTALVVTVVNPAVNAGKITLEQVNAIVAEVTGAPDTTLDMIAQGHEAHISLIATRIQDAVA